MGIGITFARSREFYLRPIGKFPFNRAVDNVAQFSIGWRGLVAHVIRHHSRITHGHLVDAVYFSSSDAHAAGFAARRILAHVPSRRARMVVTRLSDDRRLRPRLAQIR